MSEAKSNVATSTHKNQVVLAGTVVRDPDRRATKTGKTVTSFTVRTVWGKASEFHRVVAWEELAEKAALLKPEMFVEVTGRLQTRSWDDPKGGGKKYSTEIVAREISGRQNPEIGDADLPF